MRIEVKSYFNIAILAIVVMLVLIVSPSILKAEETMNTAGDKISLSNNVASVSGVTSLSSDKTNYLLEKGDIVNPSLTAIFSDTTSSDVTLLADWKSSNPTVAEVIKDSSTLRIYAKAKGFVTITASYGGKTLKINVKVTSKIESISSSNLNLTILKDHTQKVNVYLNYDDGSKENINNIVGWSSGDVRVITVENGVINGIDSGDTFVRAKFNDTWAINIPVKVVLPVVRLDPAEKISQLNLIIGESYNPSLTYYTNDYDGDCTTFATWTSSNSKVINVSNDGNTVSVSAVARGTARLTATFCGKRITWNCKVTPEITSISTDQDKFGLIVGTTRNVPKVFLTYVDGTKEDVTSSIVWYVVGTECIKVNNGRVTGLEYANYGGTYLFGNFNKWDVNIPIEVIKPIKSLAAFEPVVNMLVNEPYKNIDLIATYNDNSEEFVSSSSTYKSSNKNIADVIKIGDQFCISAYKIGKVTITAKYYNREAKITVNVLPDLVSITPGTLAIANGKTEKIRIYLNYSDGSHEDVTTKANLGWEEQNVAEISNGYIKGINVGETFLNVMYKIYNSGIRIKVYNGVVTGLSSDETNLNIVLGETWSNPILVAASYSEGSKDIIDLFADWKSSNQEVVTVTKNDINFEINAVGEGTAILTASYGGKSINFNVTVSENPNN